jgi:hypothetical protein
MKPLSLVVALLLSLSALAACAPSRVEPVQSYQGARLPRPEIVIVNSFLAAPDAVKLDSGIGARLRGAVSGTSAAMQQSEDDRKVTAIISRVLVTEIGKLGLPALASDEPPVRGGANALIIAGRILDIDEGNRTRRNIIGLGAGQSAVRARAELYYVAGPQEPRLVESFAADAESSRKPGAAETLGAGAATGRVAETAAVGVGTDLALSGDVAADSENMAKAIAKRLGQFFAEQGWIAAR